MVFFLFAGTIPGFQNGVRGFTILHFAMHINPILSKDNMQSVLWD